MTHHSKPLPGTPSSQPPSLEEATEPDQHGPELVSPTGTPTGEPEGSRSQSGDYLTTAQAARLMDTDHSLKAGRRGPILLQDHHLREKIIHFDHERIPECVVHARGAGAHGVFQSYGTRTGLTRAGYLAADVETPVFVRFSTVVESRGSADVVRETCGFAVKFYTDEGTFDLVGNNISVFFIQDAIKFPDVVHAAKPPPDREIPQAQSAHDTFWDFVSLHTEAQAHTLWFMADRGIPRSFRMMEGFGVQTFRLGNGEGELSLVKFHWKPALGVHSLVWEEAQIVNGMDPDFHRRDLADAIESGNFPSWELGVQVFPDTGDESDHFSQATLFYRSLSATEQDHVVQAYTFELGKCYEQVVRERQLVALANIDAAAPGIVQGNPEEVVAQLGTLLAAHCVWERHAPGE